MMSSSHDRPLIRTHVHTPHTNKHTHTHTHPHSLVFLRWLASANLTMMPSVVPGRLALSRTSITFLHTSTFSILRRNSRNAKQAPPTSFTYLQKPTPLQMPPLVMTLLVMMRPNGCTSRSSFYKTHREHAPRTLNTW